MKRGNHFKNQFINLIIAFAIFWVSFAAIINFHIQEHHGIDALGQLEFIKVDSKKSFKKSSNLVYKKSFNKYLDINSIDGDNDHHLSFQIIQFPYVVVNIHDVHWQSDLIRGPPQFPLL
jgi:hypothetical protein